ncbi:hypothetical protein [Deinococcus hopiensis]|uniref:Uncharacterized protein n=1 Tax=Deinococcus hopiensis KR-140 TaxID=695939 RepID=A0A1W1UX28_9DEIO|nr:hypothetical protein [Deinococcus hopiensis]SMB85586.1 hypothetical protein SAMN00790413_03462 [Deinococcus hopiensis KR-140]
MQPHLPRTLTVLTALLLAGPAHAQGVSTSPAASAGAAASEQRTSTIHLPFEAPVQARELVIAQQVPSGAQYIPGSARLNGVVTADPKRSSSSILYWVLPGQQRGVLSYEVRHSGPLGALPAPSLLARLNGERTELLSGQIDAADLRSAVAIQAVQTGEENNGVIRLPLNNSVIRTRDRIAIVVEAPQGERPTVTVNGKVVGSDRLGTEVQDGVHGVQRLTYVGVPLQPGPNVLRVGSEEVHVVLASGTARVELTPLELVANGSSPLRLRVRALDAFGTPTGQSTVTLRTNLEPRIPDVAPAEAGYQLKLTDGEGILELQPQSAPTSLTVDTLLGDQVTSSRFEVTPDRSRVGVGMVSATLGLDGDLNLSQDLTVQARAYVEAPIGAGKLYAAADKDGLPQTDNPNVRSPVFGDASTEETPLQGLDPVAAVYDHPQFRATYRRTALPIDVLPVGEQLTALTVTTKSNPTVSGFVAGVPGDRVSETSVTPDGTRILRLPDSGLSEGSETLEVVTLERSTGKELGRTPLRRNVDYILDVNTGIVTLVRPLDRFDAELNDVRVLASYRLAQPLAGRRLAYGVQVQRVGRNYKVGAAAVQLDGRTTLGARASYDNGTTRAEAKVAYSGGLQASADVTTRIGDDSATFKVRYQDQGYAGLAPFTPGFSVNGNYSARLGSNLSAVLDGEYHKTASTQGGSVTARTDYRFSAFSVGGGLKYAFGDTSGLGAVVSAGYHQAPLDLDVVHTQPLSGNLDTTTAFNVRYRVNDKVTVGLKDDITWGKGQTAAVTLDSTLGNVNYAIGYELPTASGAGNRARFGVSTVLPLNARTTLGLRGGLMYDVGQGKAEATGGADLNYRGDTYSASTGVDLVYREGQIGTVLRGGITGSVTPNLTLTADGLVEFGAGRNGQRFAVGYAYRNRTLNSLGYLRYVQGTLAGDKPELSSGVSAEYRQASWAVRGGVDTRNLLNDPGSLTVQTSLGGTLYLTNRFGVGGWARMLMQPESRQNVLGYGVEGSVLALPGTWLTAGYNFAGFDGLPSAGTYSKQGLYIRLDLTLDETLGSRK